MEGWIKLHRKVLDHWLYTEYRPLTRREAWETILLTVNYEPSKFLIKGQTYECNCGQSLLSLESWANKFVWSIQQVRTFFKLLEKDGMITTEGLQYTTRLTVCNWDIYQQEATDEQQAANKPLTDEQQTANRRLTTIKEREEYKESKEYINNTKKFDFKNSLISLGVEEKIVSDWLTVRKNKKASNTETAFNSIKKEIEKSCRPANECIKIAVEKSWRGFEAEWLENSKITSNGTTGQINTTTGFSRKDYDPNNGIGSGSEPLSSKKRPTVFS